ncbi:3819_t:CDS:2, partial [Funneliformis geosporum]
MGKKPGIMGLLKQDGKLLSYCIQNHHASYVRETLDRASYISALCRPIGNQFGVVGIQVADTTMYLNVLVKDLAGISRYFHLDHAEVPLSPIDIKEQTGDKGEPLKRCKVIDANGNKCGTIYINNGSTGNAINHLLSEYEMTKEGRKDNNQKTLPFIIQTHKHKESRQRELRQFLTDWIIEDLQPLYVVQSPSFRRLINELDPAFVIPDEKGIKKVIHKAYKFILPALIEKIRMDANNVDSKKNAQRLKQIMIADNEWDLITDLTEVLSTFADATEDLGGSKYVTNCMRTPMLMEIIKTLTTESSYDQESDEEDDAFEINDVEEGQDSTASSKINKPINTFDTLRSSDAVPERMSDCFFYRNLWWEKGEFSEKAKWEEVTLPYVLATNITIEDYEERTEEFNIHGCWEWSNGKILIYEFPSMPHEVGISAIVKQINKQCGNADGTDAEIYGFGSTRTRDRNRGKEADASFRPTKPA